MKRIILIILAAIAIILIPYLGISFALWELNPKNWSVHQRVLIPAIATVIPLALAFVNEELKDKK